MDQVKEIFRAHSVRAEADMDVLVKCIQECFDCAQACNICADACLGENQPRMLIRCVQMNLNCADICEVTGRLLSRQIEFDVNLGRKQLEACLVACQICGDECDKHAGHHEHCRICAQSCRSCMTACDNLLGTRSLTV